MAFVRNDYTRSFLCISVLLLAMTATVAACGKNAKPLPPGTDKIGEINIRGRQVTRVTRVALENVEPAVTAKVITVDTGLAITKGVQAAIPGLRELSETMRILDEQPDPAKFADRVATLKRLAEQAKGSIDGLLAGILNEQQRAGAKLILQGVIDAIQQVQDILPALKLGDDGTVTVDEALLPEARAGTATILYAAMDPVTIFGLLLQMLVSYKKARKEWDAANPGGDFPIPNSELNQLWEMDIDALESYANGLEQRLLALKAAQGGGS